MATPDQRLNLAGLEEEFDAARASLSEQDFARRFWALDPALWPGGPAEEVARTLGWVHVAAEMRKRLPEIREFADGVLADGFERVVLAGMGGSSLAPYVLGKLFPNRLPLVVLDSTHPGTVLEIERDGDLAKTLFIVASKSGSTAEPSAFDAYFWGRVGRPENFVAITDPGSPFAQSAQARGWRKVFLNFPEIGGRFSALSYFGLVPAALLGLDLERLLDAADAVTAENATDDGPAFRLGAAIGAAAQAGRDKLTLLTDPAWAPFGLWLEQLIAESTGKHDTGVLPVAGEFPGMPGDYGADRFFAVLGDGPDPRSVHPAPVARIAVSDPYEIGGEFLRWEIATAVVGAILGINPFDQPNVQQSKDITKRYLKQVEETGSLADEPAKSEEAGLALSGDVPDGGGLAAFVDSVPEGGYLAIQAYLHETAPLDAALRHLQAALRDRTRRAVTFGYGPRFLHSTGQFHKGGPKVGVFLQLLDRPAEDAAIPGQAASWATFVHAQARGDAEALRENGLRVLSVDLGENVEDAVTALTEVLA